MIKYLVIFSFFLFVGCKQVGDKVVQVMTAASILEPVSITFSQSIDFGELSVSTDSTVFSMTIKNNSSETIRKLTLNIDSQQNILKFAEDLENRSATPGHEGTCSELLLPGDTCLYKLSFTPRKIGKFTIPFVFVYENKIKEQSKDFNFTATVGEPASLSFTNDTSKYDLGVIEQTDLTKNYIDLEIKNSGGLSARDVTVVLENEHSPEAFSISKNDCPKKLLGSMTCKIRLEYYPRNNNYSDAPINYTGKISLTYLKNPKDDLDRLNAYFSFLSSTIEANFKQNFSTVEFPILVAGNKSSKSVKISNTGYRSGIMKSMDFIDYQGNKITSCKKGNNSLVLDCQKDLVNFPFLIEDSNNCFENEVAGINGKEPGSSCFFKITYWPSTTYQSGSQSTHYFDDSSISLVYDSLWRGKENIVTKKAMFAITANFIAAGKLNLEKVEIENVPLLNTDIISPTSNLYEADLGRLALVSSTNYSTYIKVTVKNTGENTVTLNHLKDGATSPHEISEVGQNINAFYKDIKFNECLNIIPGATCNFSFNLNPLVQSTSQVEDALMYDNYSYALKKYKQFIFNYKDGSSFEDNAAPSRDREFEVRLIAKLIRKGFLIIDSTNITFSPIMNGSSSVQNISVKNVGTGDVYATIKDITKNLDPKSGQKNFPYKVLDLVTITPPATKDCYDIIYPANSTSISGLPSVPEVAKFLAPGESCLLGIENRLPETARMTSSDYTDSTNYTRPFSPTLNGTGELWERNNVNQSAISLMFKYYDGDNNPDVPSTNPYGYMASTKSITIASSFSSPANIVLKDPLPVTSAVLNRPALLYPSLNATYPIPSSLSSYNLTEAFFESSYFTPPANGFTKSKNAIDHIKSLNLIGGVYENEYKYHAGTFPINQTTSFQFTFVNTSPKMALAVNLVEESQAINFPIQIASFNNLTSQPFPSMTMVSGQPVVLKFNFTPTAAGLYKRCYTLSYDSQIDTREQYVCVYAEAVTLSPQIKIEYKDVTVTQSGSSVSESESGSFINLNAPMNSFDSASKATFSAIKGSIVYAKKRFKFTNIGNASATKFNYYYMDSTTNTGTNLPADTTISTTGLANPCSVDLTLAPGAYCEFYLKYMPSTSSAGVVYRYLGTVLDIASGLNQFISFSAQMQFQALDPAKLVVNGITSETIRDWSNPAAPVPINISYPVSIGSYSNANTPPHLLLTSKPTIKSVSNIEVKNSSTLKASFLSMNPTPGADNWNPIFSNSDVVIWANRYCFFGDDENNGAILSDKKGFNINSVNKCYLQVDFSGFKPLKSDCSAWNASPLTKTVTFGQDITANCNPYVYKLTYWNFDRAAQSDIYIHMKGFIEPNRVTAASPVLSNIQAVNTSASRGQVSFSWPTLTPQNSDWGNITKYRIYYDTVSTNINSNKIFQLSSSIPFVETTNESITISNLNVGTYYYFKVVAVKSFTEVTPNLTFIANSNIPILTLPIPRTNEIYNHSFLSLIDKNFKATPGTRTTGVSTCGQDYYNLSINGTIKKAYKALITTPIFNFLSSSPDLSVGYPVDGIGAIPHWLSDAAYDIKTSISLYDGSTILGFPNYTASALDGNNIDYKLLYRKSCTSNSTTCDQLYKIVGGDGVDMYYQGVYYSPPNSISSYFRCYGVILCPTDATKLINNAACEKP